MNKHTSGTEYFGPSGAFPFLARLLAQYHPSSSPDNSRSEELPEDETFTGSSRVDPDPDSGGLSIVNLLHSKDYPVGTRQQTPGRNTSASCPITPQPETLPTSQTNPGRNLKRAAHPTDNRPPGPALKRLTSSQRNPEHRQASVNQDAPPPPSRAAGPLSTVPITGRVQLQKECIEMYFANLHLMHPFLERSKFIARCEAEIWSELPNGPPSTGERSRLFALFSMVCAVGAITAGEESFSCYRTDGTTDQSQGVHPAAETGTRNEKRRSPSLKFAKAFFDTAKRSLGDLFEVSSLETTQALFLMVGSVLTKGVYHMIEWILAVRVLSERFEATFLLPLQWHGRPHRPCHRTHQQKSWEVGGRAHCCR